MHEEHVVGARVGEQVLDALLHGVRRLVVDDLHLEVAHPGISEHGRQLLRVRGG